ncbi:T6SS immunity protein Tli4 family protein [Cupriavidus numazuensis]|uniref:Tle cognate immunity protein 4 C-terminal domain-containing protein n=1 Tax=Cupriavidus numazuensis TaxID=221992 RepID=A0ABN7QAE2_9BURK|nr:T6SS immunity protein Tli4 family protein [Cupriavidus numazuensis]CAG2160317.1 hypothetical protein LMG26411_07394 [Cupriavidus numazuensis]
MKISRTLRDAKFALCVPLLLAAGCMAQSPTSSATPVGWRTECVGLHSVDLPADFKPTEQYLSYPVGVIVNGNNQGFDLPVASGSRVTVDEFRKLEGELYEAYEKIIRRALRDARIYSRLERSAEAKAFADSIKSYPLHTPESIGRTFGRLIYGHFYLSNRVYSLAGAQQGKAEAGELTFEEKVKLFRPRELFEVPSGMGLCLPFSFIETTNRGRYERILESGVLEAHPDIEVFISDAGDDPTVQRTEKENRELIRDRLKVFWEQQPGIKQVRALKWPFPAVKMANYEGYSSLVEITRPNGNIDYGFRAIANPQGAWDSIDVYVIQRSDVARQKKIPPLTKDEFKQMADAIVSSLRKRH